MNECLFCVYLIYFIFKPGMILIAWSFLFGCSPTMKPTQVKKSNSMQTPRSQVATDIKRFHSTTGIGNGSSHMHDVQPLPKLQPSEGKEPYQIRRTEHKQVANKKPSHDLKIEPKAEPKIEPKAEPKIESKAEPKFETSKSSVINKGLSNGNKVRICVFLMSQYTFLYTEYYT